MADSSTSKEEPKEASEPVIVEQLLRRFRTGHGTHRCADTTPLRSAFDLLKETDKTRAAYVLYDIRLFDLMTQHNCPERFASMMSGTQGDGSPWSYPNLDIDFPEAALAYYADRVRETNSPFHRAVYADFLFCHGKLGARDRNACCEIAAQSYLETARTYLAEGEDYTALDGFLRAMDLAMIFNRPDLIKESVEATVQAIEHLVVMGRPRWTLELLGFLAPPSAKLAAHIAVTMIPQTVIRRCCPSTSLKTGKMPFRVPSLITTREPRKRSSSEALAAPGGPIPS